MSKLAAFACATAMALSGCAANSQFAPAFDTFKALFAKQADITLSETEKANFSYAAQFIRVADGPRATIVLAQQRGGIDYYASSEGRLVSLKQGRLIGTDGFFTDAEFADALPSPAQAIGAKQPVCWRSSWRAWGEQVAGHYLLTGCMSPVIAPKSAGAELSASSADATATSAAPELTIVREVVRSPLTDHEYTNWYWLDADRRVVKSEQQLGPLLPRWSFETIRRATDDADRKQAEPMQADSTQASSTQASSTQAGLKPTDSAQTKQIDSEAFTTPQRISFDITHGQATLNDLLQPYLAYSNIDWANSVLYSQDRESELNAERDRVAAELDKFAVHWQKNQEFGVAATARALAKDMRGWQLGSRVAMAVHPARLLISPRHNLALRAKHYVLIANGVRYQAEVAGAIHRTQLNFAGAGPLRQLRDTPLWRPGAETSAIYQLSRTGKPKLISLTEGLADSLVRPGDRFFVAFNDGWLADGFESLNRDVLAVFTHRVGEVK